MSAGGPFFGPGASASGLVWDFIWPLSLSGVVGASGFPGRLAGVPSSRVLSRVRGVRRGWRVVA